MPRGDRDNWGGARPSRGRSGRKPTSAMMRNNDVILIVVKDDDNNVKVYKGHALIQRTEDGSRVIHIRTTNGDVIGISWV